jgi:bacterioferritin-associated ferredoxin
MIVCHCFGVTDREIRASIKNGATTCADIAECCGAGSGCGGCESVVAEIVHSERRHLSVVRGDGPVSAAAWLAAYADPTQA